MMIANLMNFVQMENVFLVVMKMKIAMDHLVQHVEQITSVLILNAVLMTIVNKIKSVVMIRVLKVAEMTRIV